MLIKLRETAESVTVFCCFATVCDVKDVIVFVWSIGKNIIHCIFLYNASVPLTSIGHWICIFVRQGSFYNICVCVSERERAVQIVLYAY